MRVLIAIIFAIVLPAKLAGLTGNCWTTSSVDPTADMLKSIGNENCAVIFTSLKDLDMVVCPGLIPNTQENRNILNLRDKRRWCLPKDFSGDLLNDLSFEPFEPIERCMLTNIRQLKPCNCNARIKRNPAAERTENPACLVPCKRTFSDEDDDGENDQPKKKQKTDEVVSELGFIVWAFRTSFEIIICLVWFTCLENVVVKFVSLALKLELFHVLLRIFGLQTA